MNSPPAWVADAIFYQIFPDRFANGDPENDPVNVQEWGTPPTVEGFQGGDLLGILDHFDYLLDLGVNALYLNPIFQSTSNHRYNTTDYYQIDTKLGGEEEFKALLRHAHDRHMHIILDGVFNHCGRGFFAFQDLLENETHSPYVDWFHVRRFPLDAYGEDNALNYKAWWDIKSLPVFNTDNPQVRTYLLDVAKYWIDQGIDGWRLDVPNEIDDDSFWGEFREVVKRSNPEAYLVGEIWQADPRWVGEGHFDGLMGYALRDLLVDFIIDEKIKAAEFTSNLGDLLHIFPEKFRCSQFLTLGSHDTQRIKTACAGNVDAVKLMNLIQFSLPGAPHIYYGDEIGLEGGKDPECRAAFPWDENEWDSAHREYVRKLIDIRTRLPQLRQGGFRVVEGATGERVVSFLMELEREGALIVVNAGEKGSSVSLKGEKLPFSENSRLVDVLNGVDILRTKDHLHFELNPLEGMIVVDDGNMG